MSWKDKLKPKVLEKKEFYHLLNGETNDLSMACWNWYFYKEAQQKQASDQARRDQWVAEKLSHHQIIVISIAKLFDTSERGAYNLGKLINSAKYSVDALVYMGTDDWPKVCNADINYFSKLVDDKDSVANRLIKLRHNKIAHRNEVYSKKGKSVAAKYKVEDNEIYELLVTLLNLMGKYHLSFFGNDIKVRNLWTIINSVPS